MSHLNSYIFTIAKGIYLKLNRVSETKKEVKINTGIFMSLCDTKELKKPVEGTAKNFQADKGQMEIVTLLLNILTE